jgi:aryl-alcohol dehydrogenase-like predicted oxidoreductase
MDRRDFLRTSAGFGSAALASHRFPYEAFASPTAKHATDLVTLGRTGIKVSRLALGTGTNGVERSSNQIRGLGFQGVADLLRTGVDNGVSFWDVADQYGSHPHVRQALTAVDRDKVVIMTKTRASTEAEMRADLDRFRREMGTDRIDIVLLHCMTEDDWPRKKAGAMAVLSEAKEKSMIRAHGVSCHTLGALETAAATDWVEVDLARYNAVGAVMDAPPPQVLKVLEGMKSKGKGIIGMKILGAGQLRDHVDEALQVALGTEALDSFTIGAESQAEFLALLKKIPAASVRA